MTMTTSEDKLLFDRKAAAFALSISVRSLDYLIAGQQLKTRRIGKKVLVHRSELRRFAQGDHFAIKANIKTDDVHFRGK